MNVDLTVSLENHLAEKLKQLLPILPHSLRERLNSGVSGQSTEVHYTLLSEISQWARSDAGMDALRSIDVNPSSYNMVSLLAGTTTSPSSKFIPSTSEDPTGQGLRENNDRRALTAVINGLLTVGCSGGAAWWAADKSGWRDEWKVLLAIFVATVVGFSETVLFVIWQSRTLQSPKRAIERTAATNESPVTKPDVGLASVGQDHEEGKDTQLRRRLIRGTRD